MEPRKILLAKCYSVMGKEEVLSHQLLIRVLQECACDLLAGKNETVEQRQIMWMSYNNLRVWFNNWFEALEDLRFAERDGNDKLFSPEDQLGLILNIDETSLSID